MSVYSSLEVYPREFDEVEPCQNDCDFECGTVGYCLEKCGEGYIISDILCNKKGYNQANIDFGYLPGEKKPVPGIEIYKREVKRFIANMEKLGYKCSRYHHPCGKDYLDTVIIEDGIQPIEVAHVLVKLDVIK